MVKVNAKKTIEVKKNYGNIHINGVCISFGNTKLGYCINFALNNDTCPADAPCRLNGVCYASRLAAFRASVRKAYDKNTEILMNDPEAFWDAIDKAFQLALVHGYGFRFFEDGDCKDEEFLDNSVKLMHKYEDVTTIFMTKQYRIVNEYCDKHGGQAMADYLISRGVAFSYWPGYEMPNPYGFPVRYFLPKKSDESGKLICMNQTAKAKGLVWQCEDCVANKCGCAGGKTLWFKEH